MALGAAFLELLNLCASNGGKKRYGDIKQIMDGFQEKGFTITMPQLEYIILLRKQGVSITLNPVPPRISIEAGNNNETVSNLATDTSTNTNDSFLLTINISASNLDDDLTIEDNNSDTNTRKGGRTIGSINKLKIQCSTNLKIAITEASLHCIEEKSKAKTNNNKLTKGHSRK
jgi:hypothetical protein